MKIAVVFSYVTTRSLQPSHICSLIVQLLVSVLVCALTLAKVLNRRWFFAPCIWSSSLLCQDPRLHLVFSEYFSNFRKYFRCLKLSWRQLSWNQVLFASIMDNCFQIAINRVKISICTQKGSITSKQRNRTPPANSRNQCCLFCLSQTVKGKQNTCTLLSVSCPNFKPLLLSSWQHCTSKAPISSNLLQN